MQTVSVGEIGEKVRRPGETLQTAIDRVKNWAKEGLIKAESKNPGVGRSRQFSESTLVDALLLQFLTDAIGKSVAVAPHLEDLREEVSSARKHMRRPNAENVFLAIARPLGSDEWQMVATPVSKLEMWLSKKSADTYTLIDLGRLFARLETAGEK
jgi:hypothetical protein